MQMKTTKTTTAMREPATTQRRRKYGYANQMAHEAEGKFRRTQMLNTLRGQHDEAKRVGAKRLANKKKEKGANAGTIGGSRSSLTSAFFGR